jgi:aerobic carbon-monoxide dehydrogenase small subunit
MTALRSIRVSVNGTGYQRSVEPRMLLSDFLRMDLQLTGTHVGCEHGICGACTILFEGLPVRACLMLAVQADGKSVETVEGLADGNGLHVLQQAFWESHGLQCGFCTPGVLMTLAYALRMRPDLDDEDEIRQLLSGNLCRCTGYQNIVKATQLAARRLREAAATEPASAE